MKTDQIMRVMTLPDLRINQDRVLHVLRIGRSTLEKDVEVFRTEAGRLEQLATDAVDDDTSVAARLGAKAMTGMAEQFQQYVVEVDDIIAMIDGGVVYGAGALAIIGHDVVGIQDIAQGIAEAREDREDG